MHQQLLQAEKMASIGRLAAGVAHEINNPMEGLLEADPALLAEVRLAKEHVDLAFVRHDLNGLLGESLDGVRRVRRIVQDLCDFSHVGEDEHQTVDLHAGIDGTLNLLAAEVAHKAQLVKEYGELPRIDCVPAELNQAFLNLLTNAQEAIDRKGVIVVRTGHEGDWVWVDIQDSGCGTPRENISRIFDPFFTTKQVGQGTGLGLSVSYGIVSRHGGRIDVRSEPGDGSTFSAWLPVARRSRGLADLSQEESRTCPKIVAG